ncbi:MAG: porin family protein [Bacteroidales bacterium]|jgi:outer membrane protein X|nr:porin family protein [Bacteroidales bacterium]
MKTTEKLYARSAMQSESIQKNGVSPKNLTKSRKNFLLYCVLAIAGLTVSLTASAQEQGDIAAGANVVLGAGQEFTNFGLGAKLQYSITRPIRIEAAFNYFFEKDMTSMWDAGLNAHYLFFVSDKFTVYPLVGAGFLGSKFKWDAGEYGELLDAEDESDSYNEFGVKLGGGIDFKLTEKLFLNFEAKYRIGDLWNRTFISAGIGFRF